MSDKFLGVGVGSLNIGNGTARIYAASLGAANLDASKPVRTNSVRQLVSTYLPISDIIGLQTRLNATLTNPYNGDLNVQNLTTGITPGVQVDLNTFIANTASAIITLEDKTENIISVSQGPGITTYAGAVRADSIITADIYDAATQTQIMQLSGSEINFAVSDLTLNGVRIATVNDVGSFLHLSGGTMAGVINMGAQEIQNIGALRFKDSNMALGSSSTIGTGTLNNINIGNATTIGFGAADNVLIGHLASLNTTTAGNVVIGTIAASTLGGFNTVLGQQAQARGNAVAVGKEAVAGVSAVVVGYRSSSGLNTDSVVLGHDNISSGTSADILGVNRTNNQANTLLLGNGAYTNIRANTTCDLGTAAVPFQTLYLTNNISGPLNSRTADNIVSNSGASVSGNVAIFSGTTGKLVSDSGFTLAAYLPLAGGIMTGAINMGAQEINNVSAIRNSGSKLVIGTGAAAAGTSVAIGPNTTCSDSSVIVGINSTDVSGFAGNTSMGRGNNTNGSRIVAFGAINTSAVDDAFIFGNNLTNSTANSMIIGSAAGIVNLRTNGTVCDLGTVAKPFQTLYLNNSISGPLNSRTADNIVSNSGASVSGRLASLSGTSGKVITDSGVLAASVVVGPVSAVSGNVAIFSGTTGKLISDGGSTLAAYLPLAGGTMTGAINMGAQTITNVSTISTSTSSINIGNTNTIGIGGWVTVGAGNTAGGSGGGLSVIYGANNNTSGSTNGQSIIYGNANVDSNVAGGTFMLGFSNTNGTGQRNIFLGRNNSCPDGVNSAITMGFSQNNITSSSMLLGVSANIRTSSTTCDLGTAANPFQNLYLNTGIESTAGLVIGPTTATSIAIGRAAVTSTVNGIFATALPTGSWYSTTTYNPSFAAGVNRLTPPTAAIAGPLVDFTHALGVLTYTGARTRQFRLAYNISFTAGANGTNMIFFNSIATNTAIGTQTQQRQQITSQLALTQMSLSLIDNVTLATGQSVQLAGACAVLSGGIGYNFISCAISAQPN